MSAAPPRQANGTPSTPPLSSILNTHDFETAASTSLDAKTWAFYSSAATDCLTRERNKSYLDRIWFRPRCLRNVRTVTTSTSILGQRLDLPLYVAPAALAGLVHPQGEKDMARACFGGPTRVAQVLSNNSSFATKDVLAAAREAASTQAEKEADAAEDVPLFFQLYVDRNREKTEALLADVRQLGVQAIFVTVDAPVAGKREADERIAVDESITTAISGQKAKNDSRGGGLGRVMGSYIDSSLCWDDLKWLRSIWDGKIVLKGVQSWMDARRAAEEGIDGIVVSNHGGRSLDTSPPAIIALLELQRNCPEIFTKLEVYVDSGIRRGTDLVKCLCLGATAVGMGRSPLYALHFGREGVERLIEIMRDEVETTLRMLGVTCIEELHPGLLSTLDVDHLVNVGQGHPYATGLPLSRMKPKE